MCLRMLARIASSFSGQLFGWLANILAQLHTGTPGGALAQLAAKLSTGAIRTCSILTPNGALSQLAARRSTGAMGKCSILTSDGALAPPATQRSAGAIGKCSILTSASVGALSPLVANVGSAWGSVQFSLPMAGPPSLKDMALYTGTGTGARSRFLRSASACINSHSRLL